MNASFCMGILDHGFCISQRMVKSSFGDVDLKGGIFEDNLTLNYADVEAGELEGLRIFPPAAIGCAFGAQLVAAIQTDGQDIVQPAHF